MVENSIVLDFGTIHIWNMDVSLNENQIKSYFNILSDDEKIRASKFKFLKDQYVFIIARGVLRYLSGFYLKQNPKTIEFKNGVYGKPSYLQDFQLEFNVSHSGNRISIGFSKGQTIGVDIEKIKNDFNPIELATNFFSDEEIQALEQTKKSELFNSFYRCWTRKESFIKAVGEGLSYPLNSFAVTIDNDHQANFVKIDNEDESHKDWFLYSFVPEEGYIGAITTKEPSKRIEYFDLNELSIF